jgi:hypothetical protein
MKKRTQIFVIIFLSFFVFDLFGQGCSQCKMLSEQASELDEASFGTNINWGILYLMLIPYILLIVLFRKRLKGLFLSLTKNINKK